MAAHYFIRFYLPSQWERSWSWLAGENLKIVPKLCLGVRSRQVGQVAESSRWLLYPGRPKSHSSTWHESTWSWWCKSSWLLVPRLSKPLAFDITRRHALATGVRTSGTWNPLSWPSTAEYRMMKLKKGTWNPKSLSWPSTAEYGMMKLKKGTWNPPFLCHFLFRQLQADSGQETTWRGRRLVSPYIYYSHDQKWSNFTMMKQKKDAWNQSW